MEFDWTKRTVKEWRDLFAEVPRFNVLQAMPYARAVRSVDQKITRYALIKRGAEAVGIVAIQEIKLGLVHVIDLYRGPLWFEADPPVSWLEEFADLFSKTYPSRWLRRRRWLPEWEGSPETDAILKRHGFKFTTQTYETVWLDLSLAEDDLRRRLKSNWRNHLNQGERSISRITQDWTGATADLFLRQYGVDLTLKGYRGRKPNFVREEITAALLFREVVIFWAFDAKDTASPVAAILLFLHGRSASYRVGWTTDVGRKANAHNVLLWEATCVLKKRGLMFFDLGGVEPATGEGLTQFKYGLGGQEFRTPGVFK